MQKQGFRRLRKFDTKILKNNFFFNRLSYKAENHGLSPYIRFIRKKTNDSFKNMFFNQGKGNRNDDENRLHFASFIEDTHRHIVSAGKGSRRAWGE